MVFGFNFAGAMAVTDGTSSIRNSSAQAPPTEAKRAVAAISDRLTKTCSAISKPVRCAKDNPDRRAWVYGAPRPPTTSGNCARAELGVVREEQTGADPQASRGPAPKARPRSNRDLPCPPRRSRAPDCGTHRL